MQLNFPTYNFKVKREKDTNYVFDIIRKKFVVLTPEEWVRQHLVHYLIDEQKFPASLLAVERGLEINGLRKRFDVLAFDRSGQPRMIMECKSPDIQLNESTVWQVAVYNSRFACEYMLITNGIQHLTVLYTGEKPIIKEGIPDSGILN